MTSIWVFLVEYLLLVAAHTGGSRGLFQPRMDYDEWTPLGRGDPLKNDPTYDYVPPVLDRVNYWLEMESRTPDPPLTSAAPQPERETKKPSSPHADSRRDNFDPLIQFINERKHSLSRLRPQYIPLQGGYMTLRAPPIRPPYTVLMPPPPATDLYQTTTTTTPWGETNVTTTVKPTEEVTEGTTFATPEGTVSTTTHVHKVLSPMIDILPNGQQSLSSSLLQILLQNEMATSLQPSSPTTSTTPHPALTTDPLFSHYKQPVEPLRGPMYLIIQGHSKVKTYGASKLDNLSGFPAQEDNEVGERRRRSRQADLEDFLPVEETLEALVKDYVENGSEEEGSGIKQLLSALSS